jgi:hypothetical protein
MTTTAAPAPPSHPLRLVAASAFAVGAVGASGLLDTFFEVTRWTPLAFLGAPLLAAGALWIPRLEAQLLTRAILWGYLFWATFGSMLIPGTDGEDAQVLLALGLGAAGALALLPRAGLEAPSLGGRFVPVAFRSVILLVLVLALTDALMLFGTGMLYAEVRSHGVELPVAGFFLAGGALMGVAVLGLLRLQGWAFLLNVVGNLAIASTAWLLVALGFDMPEPLAMGLSLTALLQLLAGLPLALRIARPGSGDPSPHLARFGRLALAGCSLMLVASRAFGGFELF